jgi:hypothetical protein
VSRRESYRDAVLRALAVIAPRVPPPSLLRRDDTDLCVACWLGGTGLLQLAELLEESHGLTLQVAELLDLALAGPTLGRLLDLMEVTADGSL